MMEGKVGMRLENSTTRGKHDLQVRCIPQGGSGNPDASRWRRSTPAYPASAMQLELFSAGGIRAHGFITILMKEQMSVIRRENEVLNACRRQLADGAAEIVDHRVHHLLRLVWESGLTRVIDLLRSNDDHLSAINLL